MDDDQPTVTWFDDPAILDVALAGGKGASLGRMSQADLPVPPGFVVTTAAFRQAAEADPGGWPPGMIDEVAAAVSQAYRRLGDGDRGQPAVAVRSSATAEDDPDASFAGQQDTFLNVRGEDAVIVAVEACWASLATPRATAYRKERRVEESAVEMAVVVQAMVEADMAGVLFTADPVSRRRDRMVVNAAYGLGEAVVSGRVDPDTFVLRREDGTVGRRILGAKAITMVYADGDGLHEVPTPPDRTGRACLSDGELGALARVATDVEEAYGRPQDIEWAMHQGRVYVLQSRPITTLGPPPVVDPEDHWTRAMFREILADGPTPLFNSVLRPVLENMLAVTLRAWGFRPPADIKGCAIFYQQPYLNLRYLRAALAPLPAQAREGLVSRLANPFSAAVGSAPGSSRTRSGAVLLGRMLLAARRARRDLPAVVSRYYDGLNAFKDRDPGKMSDAELEGAIRTFCEDLIPPIIAYDFLLIASLGLVHRILEDCVRRSEVDDPEGSLADLLSGVENNLTMATNKALWELAAGARAFPLLVSAIRGLDLDAEGPPDLTPLDAAPGGPAFMAGLRTFLEQFGHRESRLDIIYPTWGEDPTPVLRFVRSYLASEGGTDPAAMEKRVAAKRRAAEERVRAGISKGLPGRVFWKPVFAWAADYNAALGGQRDTMHFHVTASFPTLRGLLRESGRRLAAAGRLQRTDDVFFLELDEILLHPAEPSIDLGSVASGRRRAWEHERSGPWPVAIKAGDEVYADEPAEARELAAHRHLAGIPGSPGRAQGVVRIVRGPEDFDRVRQGDVLVAPITNPVWTPLFAVVSAVVTDVGGVLSHGAIVAREYGIPAVVGARNATGRLREGQRVMVDGSRGVVTLIEDE